MKRLTVFLLSSLAIIACHKSSNSNSGSQGTLSATVGGTAFTANATYGIYYQTLNSFLAIGIIPSKDSTFLQVQLPWPLPIDTAFSTDSTLSGLSYYTSSGSKSYDAYTANGHALFTITLFDTINHKISGTFSGTLINDFTVTDSLVITNGKFTTAYTVD